ncbi:hypothetical protein BH09PSE6_BH09PSE6_07200 [soil metagenome]
MNEFDESTDVQSLLDAAIDFGSRYRRVPRVISALTLNREIHLANTIAREHRYADMNDVLNRAHQVCPQAVALADAGNWSSDPSFIRACATVLQSHRSTHAA